MSRRIDLRRYIRKTSFTRAEYSALKREYNRLDEEINLLRHKQSKLGVKISTQVSSTF